MQVNVVEDISKGDMLLKTGQMAVRVMRDFQVPFYSTNTSLEIVKLPLVIFGQALWPNQKPVNTESSKRPLCSACFSLAAYAHASCLCSYTVKHATKSHIQLMLQ